MRERTDHTPLDGAIAAIASQQHGVISSLQLVTLGLTRSAVANRVRAGRLHPVHRGVYAVGHRLLSLRGCWMGAVLACGDRAVLSHRSAARLHGLLLGTGSAAIDVTSPTRAGRKRQGIKVHAGASLTGADVTEEDGIPCTSVPRTLLDLAEAGSSRELERAVERAVTLRIFDLIAIQEALARSSGRRGAPRLQRAVERYRPAPTWSELERAFLEICRRARLPLPEVNVPIDLYVVDFLWRELGLIVETDGHETHSSRMAKERDNRRDRRLRNLGWRVERFSWREVMYEPMAVEAELRQLLSAAA
jgi:very-short-patch-repair endonuclease